VADEEKADEKAGGDLVAGEAYGRIWCTRKILWRLILADEDWAEVRNADPDGR
jgi:hypothetical protein